MDNIGAYQYQMSKPSDRLWNFRRTLRRQSIAGYMKKVRFEAMRSESQQHVNAIITQSQSNPTIEQVRELVSWAGQDVHNAIIQLGNMVIDRVCDPSQIGMEEWTIGNSQYWPWLINVLAEASYCTEQMFEHCRRRVITRKGDFDLINSVEVVYKCLKASPEGALNCVKHDCHLLLSLCNHMEDSNEKISQTALQILLEGTSEQDTALATNLVNTVGVGRLASSVLHVLLKDLTHRCYAVQLANNLVISGIHLQSVTLRLLQLVRVDKDRVRLEVSYYLRGVCEKVDNEVILALIRGHDLLGILREMVLQMRQSKYQDQIAQNAQLAIKAVLSRFDGLERDLLWKEMIRLGVANQLEKTHCQHEDTAMQAD